MPEPGSHRYDIDRARLRDRLEDAGTPDAPANGAGNVLWLRSSSFSDNTLIPRQHARDGGNEPPELEWEGVPENTAELALLCVDPDAPAGPFLHWLVIDLDPATTELTPGNLARAHAGATGLASPAGVAVATGT